MAAEILSDADDNSSYHYRVFYYTTDAMQAVYMALPHLIPTVILSWMLKFTPIVQMGKMLVQENK